MSVRGDRSGLVSGGVDEQVHVFEFGRMHRDSLRSLHSFEPQVFFLFEFGRSSYSVHSFALIPDPFKNSFTGDHLAVVESVGHLAAFRRSVSRSHSVR